MTVFNRIIIRRRSRGGPGAILGRSCVVFGCLGVSRGPLGGLLRALGYILGAPWPHLGGSWAVLGRSWGLLGAFLSISLDKKYGILGGLQNAIFFRGLRSLSGRSWTLLGVAVPGLLACPLDFSCGGLFGSGKKSRGRALQLPLGFS